MRNDQYAWLESGNETVCSQKMCVTMSCSCTERDVQLHSPDLFGAWIEQAFGLPGWLMVLVLFLYGAAGLAGNTIAGRFADSTPVRATLATMLILVAAINLTALSGASLLLGVVQLAIWSISHTASVTLCQVRVTLAGKDAPSFAMTPRDRHRHSRRRLGDRQPGHRCDRDCPIGFAIVALPLIILIGRHAIGTLAASAISADVRDELASLVPQLWPETWAEAVGFGVRSGFMREAPIAEYKPERLARGPMAIIGEAAHVLSPMTGSGYATGVEDAAILSEMLAQFDQSKPLSAVLEAYERARLPYTRALVNHSKDLSPEFLRYAADFQDMAV